MKDAIKRHQARRVLAISARQFIPNNDHRNAASEADQDEPRAVVRKVGQEHPREDEHEDRTELFHQRSGLLRRERADPHVAPERIAHRLNGGGFRAYTGSDVIGVELGGAAKNVIAIAAGTSDGLGFGANARSLLITRGLAEIRRLGDKMGAQAETLMGLAGLGDLVLTCTDNQSRNRRMGLLLASGKSVAEATAEIQQVVEGIKAAPEVHRLAQRYGVAMPITEVACAVIDGRMTPREAFATLASRSVRAEAK